MALLARYASHLMDKVKEVLIKQLDIGEAVVIGVTMKVITKLHNVLGLGNLEMLGEGQIVIRMRGWPSSPAIFCQRGRMWSWQARWTGWGTT